MYKFKIDKKYRLYKSQVFWSQPPKIK